MREIADRRSLEEPDNQAQPGIRGKPRNFTETRTMQYISSVRETGGDFIHSSAEEVDVELLHLGGDF